LAVEAASAVLLVAAVAAALVWANVAGGTYGHWWDWRVPLEVMAHHRWSVQQWVDDGLMTGFFFLVGVEIKRELTTGHLADRRVAALPVLAALGGMVMPALLFWAVADPAHRHGWAIPTATDIALAVAVATGLGTRVPAGMRVFLLALAVVDDIGAIVVIAIFYGQGFHPWWLLAAIGGVLVVGLGLRWRRRWWILYGVAGVGVWYALVRAGVHPTLAGVALGLVVPVAAWSPGGDADAVGVADRVARRWHPWVSFVVMPVFALANAGIRVGRHSLAAALGTRLGLGVVIGLFVGKTLGISLSSAVAVKLGWARLPQGTRPVTVVGVAMLAGVGFTVSLFVANLALVDHGAPTPALGVAKLAVLCASVLAALVGSAVLWVSTGSRGAP
jgi:NhaA family Na+:H+ antiporter